VRVAVTGATGFLGSHLCLGLRRQGHDVVVLCRPSSDRRALEASDVEAVIGDLTEPTAVDRLVRGCDAVVHAAATIAYGPRNARSHELVNVGGTRIVAGACVAARVPRLLHVSSVAAVGIPADGRPADETFGWNLADGGLGYHASKLQAEEEIRSAIARGLDAVTVNPGSLLGPHRAGFRGGEVPAAVRRRRLVPYFTGGTNVVHVEDVVAGAMAALARGRRAERYILGGENLTWRRMAEIAAEELGLRRVLVPVPPVATALASRLLPGFSRDRHLLASRFLYYSSEKARSELGYAFRPYREIVRECIGRTSA
jgi:dihydroflavonol-4-reductase